MKTLLKTDLTVGDINEGFVYNEFEEVFLLFGKETKLPTYKVEENLNEKFAVASETDKCSQFSARVIRGIEVKESILKSILL